LRAARIAAAVFSRPEFAIKLRRLPKDRCLSLGNDLLIAATALANGCGVATANRKDFELIESLLPTNLGPLYLAIWKQ
ncbi:MAG: type II toxin-antitoxin system VapC family toxin, partial [Blastocatellia bacterium]